MRASRANSRSIWFPFLLILSLLCLPACGSDGDGGTGPGGTAGGGDLPQDGSDLQVIGESGLQALEVTRAVVDQVPAWSQGFGPARASEPVWDAVQQHWSWTVEEVLQFNGSTNELRSWSFVVQYLDGETPQQTPDGATRIVGTVTLNYSLGVYTDENNNRAMSVYLICDVAITGLDQSARSVEVNGSGQINADFTINGKFSEFYTDVVGLNVMFSIVPGACPEGDGVLTINGTFVEWTYDGGAQYAWTVTRDKLLASGTATLPCGN